MCPIFSLDLSKQKRVIQCELYIYIQREYVLSSANMCYPTRVRVIQCKYVLSNVNICYPTRINEIQQEDMLFNAIRVIQRKKRAI